MSKPTPGILSVVTPPDEPVVTRDMAKLHVKQQELDDDALIDVLLDAATESGESESNRSWVTRTLALRLARWPVGGVIYLHRPPVIADAEIVVTYLDEDGAEQTVAGTVYELVPGEWEPSLVLRPGQEWPSNLQTDRAYPITVTYEAGYGAAADVPTVYRGGVLLLFGHLYENREAVIVGTSAIELPLGVERAFHTRRIIPV